jgi:hypothetical protein
MRDTWYSDNRDLVKWATLVHLARKHEIHRIVQVAYLQASPTPVLEAGDLTSPIEPAVLRHFRDLNQVQGLARIAGLDILVIDWPFSHRGRTVYAERLSDYLAEINSPKLVLLDPDTGIAPRSHDARHVTRGEVQGVWQALRKRDWLLLYQHARRSKEWVEVTQAEFAACCDGTQASVFRSRSTAPDVVLFAAQKAAV